MARWSMRGGNVRVVVSRLARAVAVGKPPNTRPAQFTGVAVQKDVSFVAGCLVLRLLSWHCKWGCGMCTKCPWGWIIYIATVVQLWMDM